jgi:hypothetical protein
MGERVTYRYATKAAVGRAVAAARACGILPGGVELRPDGTIRILPPDAKPADAYTTWEHKL